MQDANSLWPKVWSHGVADFGKVFAMLCDTGLYVNEYKIDKKKRPGTVLGKKRKPGEGEESWLFRALVHGQLLVWTSLQ